MHDEFHIGKIIYAKLAEQDRSVTWLAKKIGRNPSHLGRALKNNADIHTSLLNAISKAMHIDFYVCFSKHLALPPA